MNSTDLVDFVSSSLMRLGLCRSFDEFDVRVMSSGNSVRCDYFVLLDFLRLPEAAALKALRRIETTLQLRMKDEPSHCVVNFYVRIAATDGTKPASISGVTAAPFSMRPNALREFKWTTILHPAVEEGNLTQDSPQRPQDSQGYPFTSGVPTHKSTEVIAVCADRRMAVLRQGVANYAVVSWSDGAAPALGHSLIGELRRDEWREVLNQNTGRTLMSYLHLDLGDKVEAMQLFSGFVTTAPLPL